MQNNALQLKNELDKNIYQAEAIIDVLCNEDHFDTLNKDSLAGSLWILAEKIEQIKLLIKKT